MSKYLIVLSLIKNYDADLIELYNQVGPKNFRLIAQYSMRSLFHPEMRNQALKHIVKQDCKETENTVKKVSISFSSQKDEPIRELLLMLKPKCKSIIIKQMIRYCLGPSILIPNYFDKDIPNLSLDQQYTNLILTGISSLNTSKPSHKPRKPYKKKPVQKENKEIQERKIEEIVQTKIPKEPTAPIFVPVIDTNTDIQNINENNDTTNVSEEDEVFALLNNLLG